MRADAASDNGAHFIFQVSRSLGEIKVELGWRYCQGPGGRPKGNSAPFVFEVISGLGDGRLAASRSRDSRRGQVWAVCGDQGCTSSAQTTGPLKLDAASEDTAQLASRRLDSLQVGVGAKRVLSISGFICRSRSHQDRNYRKSTGCCAGGWMAE